MKVLGITGGLGSGKSTVCQVWNILGIPVYEADARARALYEENAELTRQLSQHFPKELFRDGRPDRKKFAQHFFGNPEGLERLNALVHPFVREDFRRWKKQQDATYAMMEAAILFESGAYKDCDKTVCVTAPEALRIERVAARDQRSVSDIKKIMDSQWTDEQRTERADFVLVNDGQHLVLPQVLQTHRAMLRFSTVEK